MNAELVGCVSTNPQPTGNLTPAEHDAVERGDASEADIVAAVTVARRSRYFPGTERHKVDVVSHQRIDVLYYDAPGTRVIVRRVHGRWKVVEHGFWQS